MIATAERQAVLVTFYPKDRRKDRASDKLEIARKMGVDAGQCVDIDLYDAPILAVRATAQQLERLRNDDNISKVEEDGRIGTASEYAGATVTPFAETVPTGIAQIGAPAAWDASRGKGIRVAILDTGIDAAHPDLAPNVRYAISFVPGETPADGNGHGTHAAGIVAAAQNGAGIVGVAPAASLFSVKVLNNAGLGQWGQALAGLQWCIANQIQIACIQFGGASAPAALEAICNAAFDRGILLVATAGSGGPTAGVACPAKYRKVIAVASVDGADVITPFSARGPEIELCAPGINVLSTAPGGGYQTWSGTAAACAHVAGAAAVAWGSHRFADNVQIWNLLAGTARPLGAPGWDPNYGYGRVQADRAALALTAPPVAPLKP